MPFCKDGEYLIIKKCRRKYIFKLIFILLNILNNLLDGNINHLLEIKNKLIKNDKDLDIKKK